GMGEVYRARDTTRKRDVELKVLPASLSSEPDRLARFEREANVLARLCRQQSRFRGLSCRLIEPVFETRPAQLRVIVRNQCPLAHLDAVVARVRVGDYLAGILARSQVPSGE